MTPSVSNNPTRLRQRMAHWLVVVARLRPGVPLARADEDLKLAVRRMEEAQPSGGGRPGTTATWDGVVAPLLDATIEIQLEGELISSALVSIVVPRPD